MPVSSKQAAPKTIVILAFDGVTLLDVVSTAEVFDVANKQVLAADRPHYKIVIASSKGAPIRSSSGIVINAVDWDTLVPEEIETVIVPGGGPPTNPPIPEVVVSRLADLAPYASRICSICTGNFILGAAGLLDGRRTTTHWQAAGRFAELFPDAKLEVDPIFTQDGKIWSSAGFTAGMDMALALLEQDEGYQTAVTMARLMIMFLKRSGGQSQFSMPLSLQASGGEDFSELHNWIANNLKQKLSVERLAQHVGMAPRTFARNYLKKVGETPAKMIARIRLDAACRQLAESDNSLKDIANQAGFLDEQNMRRAFLRAFGVSPGAYRKRFSSRFARTPEVSALPTSVAAQ